MAKQEVKKQAEAAATEEGDAPKKKSGIGKYLVMGGIGILALTVAVVVTLYFLGVFSGGKDEAEAVHAEEDQHEVAAAKLPALYVEVEKPFIVGLTSKNATGQTRQRYLQLHVAFMGRDAAAEEALKLHMPLIRNDLLKLYGRQDFKSIRTQEGKLALQAETLQLTNQILEKEGAPALEQVYFTNFVLQ